MSIPIKDNVKNTGGGATQIVITTEDAEGNPIKLERVSANVDKDCEFSIITEGGDVIVEGNVKADVFINMPFGLNADSKSDRTERGEDLTIKLSDSTAYATIQVRAHYNKVVS